MRLELESTGSGFQDFMGFQFHKGAIRTASDFVIPELDSIFQFHKGAIRTLLQFSRLLRREEISIP